MALERVRKREEGEGDEPLNVQRGVEGEETVHGLGHELGLAVEHGGEQHVAEHTILLGNLGDLIEGHRRTMGETRLLGGQGNTLLGREDGVGDLILLVEGGEGGREALER